MNENNIKNNELLSNFYKDVKYDLYLSGDKRSNRYKYNKKMESRSEQTKGLQTKGIKASGIMQTKGFIQSKGLIFLSKDPNELVDRLYLLYQEKIAGNDSKNINEEMVAIYDKLYSYNIISETDHFKMVDSLN